MVILIYNIIFDCFLYLSISLGFFKPEYSFFCNFIIYTIVILSFIGMITISFEDKQKNNYIEHLDIRIFFLLYDFITDILFLSGLLLLQLKFCFALYFIIFLLKIIIKYEYISKIEKIKKEN